MAELADALDSGSNGRKAVQVQVLLPAPENDKFRPKLVVFSYIRLRRVVLLRSDIRLAPSDIRFASFGGEYNITETAGFNITFSKRKYHSDEVGISQKAQNDMCVQSHTQNC